ncbi:MULTISPECIES: hypothetical protein [Streptomyces]|uniref:Uncharacterized protein n=1 Tax=Streptomyces xanthii TaxID=2768069 RepID=A0A7H1BHK2_9ACTN|nr:hypothetical protein [Streptomyces xanthii]QNS08207.1 hypothetical protein IAG42_34400 [Streptomyces xanthii]
MESRSGDAQAARRLVGCVTGPVAGVVGSYAGTTMLGRAWNDCEIGINASANFFSLIPVFFALWLVISVLWMLAFGFLGGRSIVAASIVSVLVTLGTYWLMMSMLGAPSGYPVSVAECAPDNAPAWWPDWLPL